MGVSIPSLKQAFISISVPPKCTYFIGSLFFMFCISLFIIQEDEEELAKHVHRLA